MIRSQKPRAGRSATAFEGVFRRRRPGLDAGKSHCISANGVLTRGSYLTWGLGSGQLCPEHHVPLPPRGGDVRAIQLQCLSGPHSGAAEQVQERAYPRLIRGRVGGRSPSIAADAPRRADSASPRRVDVRRPARVGAVEKLARRNLGVRIKGEPILGERPHSSARRAHRNAGYAGIDSRTGTSIMIPRGAEDSKCYNCAELGESQSPHSRREYLTAWHSPIGSCNRLLDKSSQVGYYLT